MSKNWIIAIVIIVLILVLWHAGFTSPTKWLHMQTYILENIDINGATFPPPYEKPVSILEQEGTKFIVPAGETEPYAWPAYGGKYLQLGNILNSSNYVIAMADTPGQSIDSEPFLCAATDESFAIPKLIVGSKNTTGSRWKTRVITCSFIERHVRHCGERPILPFMPSKFPDWISANEQMNKLITANEGEYPVATGTLTNVRYPELKFTPSETVPLRFRKYYYGFEMACSALPDKYLLIPTSNEMVFMVYKLSADMKSAQQLIATNAITYTTNSRQIDADTSRWKLDISAIQ